MEYTGHGFMQDNEPKHTSRLTMDCNEERLIDGGIQTIIYIQMGIYRWTTCIQDMVSCRTMIQSIRQGGPWTAIRKRLIDEEEFKPSYIQMDYTGHGFMQDNDPKHTSRLTMDCNKEKVNWWRNSNHHIYRWNIQMEYTGHGFMQDNDPKHMSRLNWWKDNLTEKLGKIYWNWSDIGQNDTSQQTIFISLRMRDFGGPATR